jgi:hypothetical protein
MSLLLKVVAELIDPVMAGYGDRIPISIEDSGGGR